MAYTPYQPYGYSLNIQPQSYQSLVHVQSEAEGVNFPVAPGNVVVLFNDVTKDIYLKTLNSQFGNPTFDKYVKAPTAPSNEASKKPINFTDFATKAEFEALREELEAIKGNIKGTSELLKGDEGNG